MDKQLLELSENTPQDLLMRHFHMLQNNMIASNKRLIHPLGSNAETRHLDFIGGMAAAAYLIYYSICHRSTWVNYAKVLSAISIIGSCLFGSMLMAISEALLLKFRYPQAKRILNIFIFLLSFASVTGPISDTPNPELFPVLVLPMHFFPALAYFTLSPFFTSENPIRK